MVKKMVSLEPPYTLKIVAKDSFELPRTSVPVTLFIRLSNKPTIQLIDTKIGAFKFETTVDLTGFSHLQNVETLEIAIQQYHPENPLCKY